MEFDINSERINLIKDNKVVGMVRFAVEESKMRISTVYVDNAYRGQGLAQILMEQAMNYASKNNLEIEAICTYAQSYLDKKKEM